MLYYALFDAEKNLKTVFPDNGRYSDLIPDAIQISESQFLALLPYKHWRLDDTHQIIENLPPPPEPPTLAQIRARTRCAAWQFRRALTQLGWRASVEAAVAAAGQDVMDMWEYAANFERLHPMIATLAAAVNKTDADIDAVFELALTYQE